MAPEPDAPTDAATAYYADPKNGPLTPAEFAERFQWKRKPTLADASLLADRFVVCRDGLIRPR